MTVDSLSNMGFRLDSLKRALVATVERSGELWIWDLSMEALSAGGSYATKLEAIRALSVALAELATRFEGAESAAKQAPEAPLKLLQDSE